MKRFKGVYLLHGKGGSPNGTVRLLKHAMVSHIAGIIFMRPHLAHHDPQVSAEESMEQLLRCEALKRRRKERLGDRFLFAFKLGTPTTLAQLPDVKALRGRLELRLLHDKACLSCREHPVFGI